MVEMMVEMMEVSQWRAGEGQAGLTDRSSAGGEWCLGRKGGDKQESGPPATSLGCASPKDCSLPVLGLSLLRG